MPRYSKLVRYKNTMPTVYRNNYFSIKEELNENELSIAIELDKTKPFSVAKGHLDIRMGNSTISSRSKTPDQSFILIPSLNDLLEGLLRLICGDKSTNYFFVGDDSSFAMIFKLLPGEILHLRYDNIIFEMPFKHFSERLMCECERILNHSDDLAASSHEILVELNANLRKLKSFSHVK